MGKNTGISWTDHSINMWWGCAKISPACDNCYAEVFSNRVSDEDYWAPKSGVKPIKSWRSSLLKWNREAEDKNAPALVFAMSMGDLFDNRDKKVTAPLRKEFFEYIKKTPWLTYLILTKRIGNALDMLPADWGDGYDNVWLGATIVNQEEADRDIPKLLSTPTKNRFLSMEPLVSNVNLSSYIDELDWVIVGGESGSKSARGLNVTDVRIIRDEVKNAGKMFFFKQWGSYDSDGVYRGALPKSAGKELDSAVWCERPLPFLPDQKAS